MIIPFSEVNDFHHWFDELVHDMTDLQTAVHQQEMDERRRKEDECLGLDKYYQFWSDKLSQKAIEEQDKCEE